MKIRKLRRKLRNEKWLFRMMKHYANRLEDWENFKRFSCESFFVGYAKAEVNRSIYHKKTPRLERHYKFLKTLYYFGEVVQDV